MGSRLSKDVDGRTELRRKRGAGLRGGHPEAWRPTDLVRFAPEPAPSTHRHAATVSEGSWHVGAVMAYAIDRMIARAQRMLGRAASVGLDRNGINIERRSRRKTGKPLHRWTGASSRSAAKRSRPSQRPARARRRVGSRDFEHTSTRTRRVPRLHQRSFLELWPKGLFPRRTPDVLCPAARRRSRRPTSITRTPSTLCG